MKTSTYVAQFVMLLCAFFNRNQYASNLLSYKGFGRVAELAEVRTSNKSGSCKTTMKKVREVNLCHTVFCALQTA